MECGYYAADTGTDKSRIVAVRALPPGERPRERLIKYGPEALSDRELLAILLNAGVKGKNVAVLASDLLARLDQDKGIPSVEDLILLTGLGECKACAIAAMLEFGRRRWGSSGTKIRHPSDIYALIRHNADRKREHFLCASLNGAHEVIAVRVITVGLVNRTIVHPREVYADVITDRAVAVVVAHNHPSGRLIPSGEDDDITIRLKAAADILGINFLDHLIFSHEAYFSYRQSGRLDENVPEITAAPNDMDE
jgi:DNA repair protein RadC